MTLRTSDLEGLNRNMGRHNTRDLPQWVKHELTGVIDLIQSHQCGDYQDDALLAGLSALAFLLAG
jgi:hypothetical protein